MAHDLTQRINGTYEIAFVGEQPWHGYGQLLLPSSSIEDWRTAAGLDWTIERSPVQFKNGIMHTSTESEVLYRSDTNTELSVVSKRYKVVQPAEVLEFFRDLVAQQGFQLETAGTLKGGKRIWALAKTGFDGEVVAGDTVKTYLLLVTSCDGSVATTAQFTSIRVVCQNTLHMSMQRQNLDMESRVKVRHNTTFDATSVHEALGLNAKPVFDSFMEKMKSLANKSLSGQQTERLLQHLFKVSDPLDPPKGYKTVLQLFEGAGKGSRFEGVAGTGWGLINAVTEYTDYHIRARNAENRTDSAWFGVGANMKEKMVRLLEEV